VNATKNLKRKCRHDVVFFYLTVDNVVTSANAHHQTLLAQDTRIEQHNKRLRASSDKVTAAHNNVLASGTNPEVHARAEIKLAQAERVYEKQVSVGQNLIGTGSGKVGIYLPQRDR
jgi:hypothetical protein